MSGFSGLGAIGRSGGGASAGAAAGGASAGGGSPGLSQFSGATAIGGALVSSIGAFYGAQAQRYTLRSNALSLLYQASTAGLNAEIAERDAAAIMAAGKYDKALSTLRFGQVKATSKTAQAAAGVQAGVGSAGEVQASIELTKDLDALTIETNAVRAVGAARLRAVDFRNQASLARVSAANAHRFSSTISPGLSAFTSLIGGASQVTSMFLSRSGRS